MKTEKTAMQQILERFDYGNRGALFSSNEIVTVAIGLLELEKKQLKRAFQDGSHFTGLKEADIENYYKQNFTN